MIIQLVVIIVGLIIFFPFIACLMMAYMKLWIKGYEWINKKFFGGKL